MSNLARVREWVQNTTLAEFTASVVAHEIGINKLYAQTHLRTLKQAGEVEVAALGESRFRSGCPRKTEQKWRKVV